jgi:acyl carrier protein
MRVLTITVFPCKKYIPKKIKEIKMSELKNAILDYVKKEYLEEDDDREITFNTPLISGGIVDSFSMVSLKRFLETRYKIQIPDAKASPEAFDSVDNIIKLLQEFNIQ